MNAAEQFVYRVCRSSFLSPWSYANPIGKGGKELCDVLVVCEPTIIVISVKDVAFRETENRTTDWERWNRRAIEDSAKQIYGAQRWLADAQAVIRSDGSLGVDLPAQDHRQLHRIAVALGGRGNVPLQFGDLGKGFVHSLDERSFFILLNELDTISDFVEYLTKKEQFFVTGKTALFSGEEDMLASYLHGGRAFPQSDLAVIDETVWRGFTQKPEYRAKKEADQESYVWDALIERFAKHALEGTLEFDASFADTERILRIMAKEDRFSRRLLGSSFKDFIERSDTRRARMTRSPSGTVYVFMAGPLGEDRRHRVNELTLRSLVARGKHSDATTVVGIGTEQKNESGGYSLDGVLLEIPEWTTEHQAQMEAIQAELGYFQNPVESIQSVDEYPVPKPAKVG
jgi:hypothetical protein